MINSQEIKALISLLDDPDEFIFTEVKIKLMSFGNDAISYLEEFWEDNSLDTNSQDRIENLIQEIQFKVIYEELKSWGKSKNKDLLESVLILNRYQYPDLDEKSVLEKIDKIKQDIWLEITKNLTAFEKINVINKILFEEYEFSGNKENYHSPNNSYLNNVLETKKGNPLSLSIIYLLVTQDLGLPIYGVNLPNHFVVCYLDEENTNFHVMENEEKVLIYINPFSKGKMFNHEEIDRFLFQLNSPSKQEYYLPCSNMNIVKRMIHNLIFSYEKLGYSHKIEELKQLLEIVS